MLPRPVFSQNPVRAVWSAWPSAPSPIRRFPSTPPPWLYVLGASGTGGLRLFPVAPSPSLAWRGASGLFSEPSVTHTRSLPNGPVGAQAPRERL